MKARLVWLFLFALLIPGAAFAEDLNLTDAIPTTLFATGFMTAVALVLGAVGGMKAIQYVIRLIRRA